MAAPGCTMGRRQPNEGAAIWAMSCWETLQTTYRFVGTMLPVGWGADHKATNAQRWFEEDGNEI